MAGDIPRGAVAALAKEPAAAMPMFAAFGGVYRHAKPFAERVGICSRPCDLVVLWRTYLVKEKIAWGNAETSEYG